jgi:hypothetical protein
LTNFITFAVGMKDLCSHASDEEYNAISACEYFYPPPKKYAQFFQDYMSQAFLRFLSTNRIQSDTRLLNQLRRRLLKHAIRLAWMIHKFDLQCAGIDKDSNTRCEKRIAKVSDVVDFDCDHINPETKFDTVTKVLLSHSTAVVLINELNKCQLLCRWCHKQKSDMEISGRFQNNFRCSSDGEEVSNYKISQHKKILIEKGDTNIVQTTSSKKTLGIKRKFIQTTLSSKIT